MITMNPNPSSTGTERVVLVTGGTDGIGRAVALSLATAGDRVLFVGRNADKGAQVLRALQQASPGRAHEFIAADLSLLSETARVGRTVAQRCAHLDAAVFCAGVLSMVPQWTSEGLEDTFVLNYLSRYLLVRQLLPQLRASASGRVVLVANAGKYLDTLDFGDLQHRAGRPGLQVSGRTQFANDLFAVELQHRLRDTRVQASCVFPGLTRTAVFEHARGAPRWMVTAARTVQALFGLQPAVSAQTPAYLARDPRAAASGGRFFGPRCKEIVVPERARRPDRREALWEASEALVRHHL